MSLRAAVVPILPSCAHSGAPPVSSLCLHGQPLFVHAARALASLPGARVVVTTPTGPSGEVQRALTKAQLAGVRVMTGVDSVGAALAIALDDVVGSSRIGGQHEVGVVLLHDPRCPLVPASFLGEVLGRAVDEPGAVHVGTRPVTDTVKAVDDGSVRATVDRDILRVLTSPLVLSVTTLRRLYDDGHLLGCVDIVDVLELVRATGIRVRWVAASNLSRRIEDQAEVSLLECLVEVRANARG